MSDYCLSSRSLSSMFLVISSIQRNVYYYALSSDDMISYSTAERIISSSYGSLWRSIFVHLNAKYQILLFQFLINTIVFMWQYTSSWLTYFITSVSGIKLLYKVLFKQPGILIPFIISFLIIPLGSTDTFAITKIESLFGLDGSTQIRMWNATKNSQYSVLYEILDFGMNIFSGLFGGVKLSDRYIRWATEKMISVVMVIESTKIRKIDITKLFTGSDNIFIPVKTEDIACFDKESIYIDYNDSDIRTFYDKVTTKEYIKEIEKEEKKKGGSKRDKKERIQKRIELQDNTIRKCISGCNQRNRTIKGEWCKGECGSTMGFGNSWCRIEPNTSRHRDVKRQGWDYCHTDRVSEKPLCFTGSRFLPC